MGTEPTFWQWLVHINDFKQLWEAQPSYMISQVVFVLAGVTTLIHACRKGGRWPYFWLGTVFHGLFADNFVHIMLPDYDNFWQSQTPIMLLGYRLPLHIIFLYPAFMYHAAYAVSRLNLPTFAEPFAVGLLTVLIDLPYDIVGVKFVHWTWHDTDPNIYDRHYWVPWNSFYFHSTFAASFYFLFHASRKWFAQNNHRWESARKSVEWKSVLIASACGFPGGILLFLPVYHPLHDLLKIHSEVTYFVLFSVFSIIILNALIRRHETISNSLTTIDYVLLIQLFIHYATYWMLVVFFHPEKEWSLGLHEPVGPCDQYTTLRTVLGQTLHKRKYFCPDDYDEGYFDFRCMGNKRPPNGAVWYVVCGTPFENRAEYVTILTTILVVAAGIFYGIYFGANTPKAPQKKLKSK